MYICDILQMSICHTTRIGPHVFVLKLFIVLILFYTIMGYILIDFLLISIIMYVGHSINYYIYFVFITCLYIK